jgi:hypothetical protein
MFLFDYLSYILCFGLLVIIVIYFYIRLKYGFWASQPVFHYYDISYRLRPPGIIKTSLPDKNKYTNFKDIDTIIFSNLNSIQKQRFLQLIQNNYYWNYYWNKNNRTPILFSPKPANILSYFTGSNQKSFVSFFYKDTNMLNLKKGTVIVDRQIIGAITSRPLVVSIADGVSDIRESTFGAYYMDYLCVDKIHRKNGIVSQLIQTHEYNQRHLNKKSVVSILKREGEEKWLAGVVPFCRYTNFGFPVDRWTKPSNLSAEYTVLEINAQNFRFLHDFVAINSDKFDIIIKNDMTNIMELIKTKNIFIYSILSSDIMLCCYFFRKTCIQVEKGLEGLCCFASICSCDENIFIHGYKISFWKIAAENYFGFSFIENISHNGILINNIIQKTMPTISQKNAYYFYNFAYPTFAPEKCFIVH